ncbi:MAG: glycosyltransferase family 4 protein [Elusimicrobia bacterium]|nr:glycosyltransferase family 4 protein [Elusimicrobiota bacterium]
MTNGELLRKPRVLVVLEMGYLWTTGFVRAGIFKEHFARAGYSVRFVNHNFTGPLLWRFKSLFSLFRALNELRIVYLARSCDAVYMCKVQSGRLVAMLRRRTKARLVLDAGDAGMPQYATAELNSALAAADAVTTDNELTAGYVRRFNKNCTVVPDSPQIELFDSMRAEIRKNASGPVILGWVGSSSTVYNLFLIWETLERLFARHENLHLRLVGVGRDLRLLPPFEKVRYSFVESYTQKEMVREVLKMDIGLYPLHNIEASYYRGVLKASVYMSGEAAAVCSPVGQCADFIKDGVNGMLAAAPQEWERKLETLINDRVLRQTLAKGGLETVRGNLTLDRAFSTLRSVIEGESHG